MPTYEYQCRSCGHSFEEFQSMSAPPLRKCPGCGSPSLERLISGGMGIIVAGATSEPAAAPCGPACGCHPAAAAGGATTGPVAHSTTPGARGAASSGASSRVSGASPMGSNGASTAPSDAASKDAKAASNDPERATWKSKATHYSREGRGIGNLGSILKNPTARGRKKDGFGSVGSRGPVQSRSVPSRAVPRRRSP